MNATLEAMARALFQSWFVDFDPVRAKLDLPARSLPVRGMQTGAHAVRRAPAGLDAETAALFPAKFQDSPLGPIPQGWTVQRLPDAIDVNPRRTLQTGTVAPYLDMKNLPTQGHCADEVVDREFSSGTKFKTVIRSSPESRLALRTAKPASLTFSVTAQSVGDRPNTLSLTRNRRCRRSSAISSPAPTLYAHTQFRT